MTDTALLSGRIRDHVEALVADGAEGDRLPTMAELRRLFGGASNGAVQQGLAPPEGYRGSRYHSWPPRRPLHRPQGLG